MKYTLPEVAKAVVAGILAVVTVAATAAADGQIDAVEALGIIGAAVTAYGVFKARNKPAADGV